jgi:hypothetical protein
MPDVQWVPIPKAVYANDDDATELGADLGKVSSFMRDPPAVPEESLQTLDRLHRCSRIPGYSASTKCFGTSTNPCGGTVTPSGFRVQAPGPRWANMCGISRHWSVSRTNTSFTPVGWDPISPCRHSSLSISAEEVSFAATL